MTIQPPVLNPNRLYLQPHPAGIWLIWNGGRVIGQCSKRPIVTKLGIATQAVVLNRRVSEQLKDRIRDLVNKALTANHDLKVATPPNFNDPKIVRIAEQYLINKATQW